jgi:hypothetical protein
MNDEELNNSLTINKSIIKIYFVTAANFNFSGELSNNILNLKKKYIQSEVYLSTQCSSAYLCCATHKQTQQHTNTKYTERRPIIYHPS